MSSVNRDVIHEEVVHDTFGRGNVVNCDDSYIRINFESGDKRFVFPDVFKTHIKFINQRMTNRVKEKIEKKEEMRRKEAIIEEKEKALERERQEMLEHRRRMKNRKIHPETQSVFWCEEGEEDSIFTEWKVFTGEIKSGKKKGQPRRLARMDQNSGCLITKRESDNPEEGRRILGLFMANESFDGRECEDGYIRAHPEYRIHLSQEESEKMLFWNYYRDKRTPDRTTWNSGRQRYFDNIWMAQILQDIASLKEKPEERKYVQTFLEYFCRANNIEEDEIPPAKGALKFEA